MFDGELIVDYTVARSCMPMGYDFIDQMIAQGYIERVDEDGQYTVLKLKSDAVVPDGYFYARSGCIYILDSDHFNVTVQIKETR